MADEVQYNTGTAIRLSAVVLDQTVNPTKSEDLSAADPERLVAACGLIPDIFAAACCKVDKDRRPGDIDTMTLDKVAAAMNEEYGFGGFRYPFSGAVDADGTYRADDDPPIAPLVRYVYPGFECLVYRYAITALREIATGETRIARFD
tara:strand:- start:238 stop:681 length:444 start_codon:yes stop_codon:yes gene_type:complete